MDMTMVDITGTENISVRDMVQIFGELQSIDEYATSIGTIAYEVISGIAPRVRRIYVSNWQLGIIIYPTFIYIIKVITLHLHTFTL